MRVVLVSTYDLGHQPFGLASPAAWLRARGHEVTTADLSVGVPPVKAFRQADCVAFYLPMHTATRLAAPLITQVRGINPGAKLIAYGLYAPLNAEYLRGLGVAEVIGGEYEAALVEAVEGRNDGPPVRLDRLQFAVPDRTTLPDLGLYARVVVDGSRRTAGYTETSRGCKHLCRHCPIVPVYEGAFRVVQRDVVLQDIRRQIEAGAQHITFGDPDFFNGPSHAVQLVEAFHREWTGCTYDVTIKIEHLLKNRDLLPVLSRTGCLFVTSAVESTEDHVLEKLAKGHTRADFLEALQLTRSAGLHLSPTFVPFTPWTTLDGYRDLLQVMVEHGLVDAVAPVQLSLRLLIPHGSKVLELPGIAPKLRGFDEAGLLHRWQHEDPRVDELAAQVFRIVAEGQKAGLERRVVFERIWEVAHGAAPPENYRLLPRAVVPYLDEPWYC